MTQGAAKMEDAMATGKVALVKRAWATKRDQIALTAVRVTVGLLFLNSAIGKLTSPTYISGFAATNRGFAAKTSFGWYADFLNGAVIPNATFWANLTMYGEFLVGLALILGLLTNLGAVAAIFLNLNFWLAAGQTGSTFSVNILMGVAAAAFLVSPAAKYLSVDRFLAERVFRRIADKHPKLVRAFLQRQLAG
jgi:thiosulfate dehydrogenase [quinone] large subunit